MDYGSLLKRAWDLLWDNKWLIILGVIVALGSGGTGNSLSNTGNFGQGNDQGDFDFNPEDFESFEDFEGFEAFEGFESGDFDQEDFTKAMAIAGPIMIIAIIFGVIIGIIFWAVSMVAQGGLIGGVDTLAKGGVSDFRSAWGIGWSNIWRLLGIGLVPAIPGAVIAGSMLFLGVAGYTTGGMGFFSGAAARTPIIVTIVSVMCVAGVLSFVLGIIANFAYRAAILEDKTVFEAYERGFQVLRENLGPAVLLWLIQVGIGLGIGIAMILPSLCCVLWPVMVVVNGGIQAYFSTVWTLAYNDMTGSPEVIEAAPAV